MMEKQVKKEHYEFIKYVSKERFMSYYYQIKYIYDLNPKKVLEIGGGNSFIKKVTSSDGLDYSVMDIDSELKPDLIGTVTNIPEKDNSYDLVVCFQVLEHIPFSNFESALKEISRVSAKNVIISLPYSKVYFIFELKIPLLKKIHICFTIPNFYKKHKFDGEHYWEIGKKDYSLKKIKKIISKYFLINEILNPYENQYYTFFKLLKK